MQKETRVSLKSHFSPKRLMRLLFGLFGLRISRICQASPTGNHKYFNTGLLTPREENSCEMFERWYSDHGALAEYYQGARLAFYKAISTEARAQGLLLDGKDVLDVGCGTGHLIAALSEWSRPRTLAGCDFSEQAIKFSTEHFPGCTFFLHDIYQPLPQKFDVVLCTEVLEHLERPHCALKTLLGALRPAGALVLTVPNGRRDTINQHINFWSPESWKVFLERECPERDTKTTLLMDGLVNFALVRQRGSPAPPT